MVCNSPIFICCSASSGSTLLSSCLSQHKDIIIGPEVYLFDKPAIWDDFDILKQNLVGTISRGTFSAGQVAERAFLINLGFFGVVDADVDFIAKNSSNVKEFVDVLYGKLLDRSGSTVWGDKTGSNIYCMDSILEIYPDAKILHLVRDPNDCISSMVKRGASLVHATSHYLSNNFCCLKYKNNSGYMLIKYEEFVKDFERVVDEICTHVGVQSYLANRVSDDYWDQHVDRAKNIHSSWLNDPLSEPNIKSIGKGDLTLEQKMVVDGLKLNSHAVEILGIDQCDDFDIDMLCKLLGYEFNAPKVCKNKMTTFTSVVLEVWARFLKTKSLNQLNPFVSVK